MIISAFGFALMGVFLKKAGDLPVMQKVVFRSFIIMVVTFVLLKANKINMSIKTTWKPLLLRCIFGTIGMMFAYWAIDHLILSDSTVIGKMSSFFVLIFSSIFLKEKMKKEHIIFIVLAFFGVILVARPSFSIEVLPYGIALLGAIFAAGAYTMLRVLGGKIQPIVTVFYFALFGFVVITPYTLFTFESMSSYQVLMLVLAGVFATVGQLGATFAYKYAAAKEISIYNYTGVVFSAIFSVIFFGQYPGMLSIIGYVIIFTSSYLMYRFNKQVVNVE